MPSNRICIVLLHRSPHTLACLSSLNRMIYPQFTQFVVDTGCSPNLAPYRDGILIKGGTSPNVGIEWALTKPFQWILLLSNEAIVDPHILTALIDQAKATPDAKIFGAKILQRDHPSCIAHLGGWWDQKQANGVSIGAGMLDGAPYNESQIVDYVGAEALFMHRTVPERIGLFEPRFRQSFEDLDFCFRARRKGFLVRTAPQAKIWCKARDPIPFFVEWKDRLLWYKRNLTHAERKQAIWTGIRTLLRS